MESSRRRFLQLAGISAVGLSAKPIFNAFAAEHGEGSEPHFQKGEKALLAKQWAMVIDTRKLQTIEDLEPMIEACHKIHNVPKLEDKNHEIKWIWESEYHNG